MCHGHPELVEKSTYYYRARYYEIAGRFLGDTKCFNAEVAEEQRRAAGFAQGRFICGGHRWADQGPTHKFVNDPTQPKIGLKWGTLQALVVQPVVFVPANVDSSAATIITI